VNIILVEDEGITTLFLKDTLESLGHSCQALFSNAIELFEYLHKNNSIDIIFMDICLHGPMDGIQAAEKLKKLYPQIAVVFLTSYSDSQTISAASVAKPLGYLIKPVGKSNLEAILMVVQSNAQHSQPPEENSKIEFSDEYCYDKQQKMVYFENESVKLTNKELKCVEALVLNKNNYISIDQLMCIIWGDDGRYSSLRELIYRIRKKLPKISITSIPNVGYMLN
jgi:DNA-binding response OmpR family regulator